MNAKRSVMSAHTGLLAMLCGVGIFSCAAPSEDASESGSALENNIAPPSAKFIDKANAPPTSSSSSWRRRST